MRGESGRAMQSRHARVAKTERHALLGNQALGAQFGFEAWERSAQIDARVLQVVSASSSRVKNPPLRRGHVKNVDETSCSAEIARSAPALELAAERIF